MAAVSSSLISMRNPQAQISPGNFPLPLLSFIFFFLMCGLYNQVLCVFLACVLELNKSGRRILLIKLKDLLERSFHFIEGANVYCS